MRRLLLFSVVAVLAFVVTPALATGPTTDSFSISLVEDNIFNYGYGTGYNNFCGIELSPWYYYGNTGWYSQWFYDDPPDPTRWQEITYEIDIIALSFPTDVTHVMIALNWSTLAYPERGPNGPPPLPQLFYPPYVWLEDVFIAREVIFDDIVQFGASITGTFIIPDYNPEWVSIGIYGETGILPVSVGGTITHECVVPVPGAVLLGILGLGAVGIKLRKFA